MRTDPGDQPGNWRYYREEIDTEHYNPKTKEADPHSWEYSYIPYLKDQPAKIKKGKICD